MNDIFGPWPEFVGQFLPGLLVTLELTVLALLLGLPFGVVLATLASAKEKPVRWITIAIIELGRGTPGLIVLYLVYFGLPQINVVLPSFIAAVVALGFSTAAYTSEIIRAGIRSVPDGQKEAARALALSPDLELRLVVLPQALRRVVGPLVGFAILLYQGTSLAYAIAVPELLSRAYNAASLTYQFTSALLLAGLMYAAISMTATLLANSRFGTARP